LKKLFIFDWNGTLQNDTRYLYDHGVKAVFARWGVPCPDFDTFRDQVSTSYMESFYWPNGIPRSVTPEEADVVFKRSLVECGVEPPLFDGAREVLHFLKNSGHHLCLVSAHVPEAFAKEFGRHGLEGVFEAMMAGVRDKPAAFRQLMVDCGVPSSRTFCIGDNVGDARAANAVEAIAIAVPNGVHTRERFERSENVAFVMLDSIEQVGQYA
jgi:phosphoglycolate phosphatase-like HAD superfamily hydrolase